jgi:hypothetical protein
MTCLIQNALKNVILYKITNNLEIDVLCSICLHPFYILQNQVLIVVPNELQHKCLRYYQRLKNAEGNFTIKDAISYEI